jgi:hypothetical protein
LANDERETGHLAVASHGEFQSDNDAEDNNLVVDAADRTRKTPGCPNSIREIYGLSLVGGLD